MDGSLKVGLSPEELERFATSGDAVKVARRDVPMAVATGALGATTVSATIWAARAAGIVVSATGGVGGVHPGDGDVSADLLELARTPVLLVCSGPKSIIDAAATAERLRSWAWRSSATAWTACRGSWRPGHPMSSSSTAWTRRRTPRGWRALRDLRAESAILLCNPIPAGTAMNGEEVAAASREAETRAERDGVHDKARTPHLLAALAEITVGRSRMPT